jgi:hypothetical protein
VKIAPVDHEAELDPVRLVLIEADVVVGPALVERQVQMLNRVVPPPVVGCGRTELGVLTRDRRPHGLDRLLQSDAVLSAGAVPDEAHDDRHRQDDQERNRYNDVLLELMARSTHRFPR